MSNPAKNRPAALPPLTDELIESSNDLSAYMSNPRAVPAMLEPQKVNVDFPSWVVAALDREANRIGVPRQSLIKLWIAERLATAEHPSSLQEIIHGAQAEPPSGTKYESGTILKSKRVAPRRATKTEPASKAKRAG